MISVQGIAADKGKIEAIKKWPIPQKCCGGPKIPGIHGILLLVYPKICAGSPTPAQVNLGKNAGKKKAAIQWGNRC